MNKTISFSGPGTSEAGPYTHLWDWDMVEAAVEDEVRIEISDAGSEWGDPYDGSDEGFDAAVALERDEIMRLFKLDLTNYKFKSGVTLWLEDADNEEGG